MAVFTAVDAGQLEALKVQFGLPGQLRAEGIAAGIENTNYLLFEDARQTPGWVLTLLEKPTELHYVQAVLAAAHAAGLPVPLPLATREGVRFLSVGGRTMVLTRYLQGSHPEHPSPAQCAAIGRFLGRLHDRVEPAAPPHADPQGLQWTLETAKNLLAGDPVARDCIRLLKLAEGTLSGLQQATCHGDLFRDNTLFLDDRLAGVIDWYNAARAPTGYDLAIVLNDWCTQDEGRLDADRARALLAGYRSECSLHKDVTAWMPTLRAWAALRFWTSRTDSALHGTGDNDRPATGLYRGKPPLEQKQKLEAALDPAEQAQWRDIVSVTG